MAERHGQITTCDRCGVEHFRPHVRTIDCGFLYRYEFEPLPDGWSRHENTGDLCPDCSAEYDERVNAFMEEKRK